MSGRTSTLDQIFGGRGVTEMYFACDENSSELQLKTLKRSKDAVVIICKDTNAFSIAKADIIGVSIYLKRGTSNDLLIVSKAFLEYMHSTVVIHSEHLQGERKSGFPESFS